MYLPASDPRILCELRTGCQLWQLLQLERPLVLPLGQRPLGQPLEQLQPLGLQGVQERNHSRQKYRIARFP